MRGVARHALASFLGLYTSSIVIPMQMLLKTAPVASPPPLSAALLTVMGYE